MALKDKATFIAAIDTAAAALTAALKDENLNSVATEISSPQTPLRQVEKLINLSDDGTFTGDDIYIAQAYAGEFPIKGSQDLSKVVGEAAAPLGLLRLFQDGWDLFTEAAQGVMVAANDSGSYGIAKLNQGGDDESAILISWLDPSGTKTVRMEEVANPSNSVNQLCVMDTPGGLGLVNTYPYFWVTNAVWSLGIPANGAEIRIFEPQ